jgi:hypothetical protein
VRSSLPLSRWAASLVGANRDLILNRIPHIARLMVSGIDAVLSHAQTIVGGNNTSKPWPTGSREEQVSSRFCANYRSQGLQPQL